MVDDAFDRHEDHVAVPFRRKLAYGMGATGDTLMSGPLRGNMRYYFIVIMRLNPVLYGWALLMPRLWDAVTDPLMGHISDNFRSRFGRRRPFILIGGLLSCLVGIVLYAVPSGLSESSKFVWLLGFMLLFTTFHTVMYVPYNALGCELSTDYDERTRVFAVQMVVMQIMQLFTAPFFQIANKRSWFPDPRTGYLTVLVVLAVLSPLGLLWTFLGTREEGEIQSQEKIPMGAAVRTTLMNKPFLILMAFLLVCGIVLNAMLPFSIFVNVFHVFGGDADAAGKMVTCSMWVGALSGFVSIFICRWLGTAIGKRNAIVAVLVFWVCAQACSWFLYNPKYPWLLLVHSGLENLATGFSMLILAMTADIVDEDEVRTGTRREGMYTGVRALVNKVTGAAGVLWMGYFLRFAGFDEALPAQAPATIQNIRVIYAFYPIPFVALAILILLFYPLTKRRVRAMREELERRRIS
jgi:GPH family glycoside/pentoside/hexuronide:cation symporter